ncbi:MAG TPA: efflux RND transporter periplasmic adaptor subunit [Pyrinomonadaceae bacterium]|nr:efflux RND transporter periplasmic adaptor subunit [Pyrinomonadaceae bacterium]
MKTKDKAQSTKHILAVLMSGTLLIAGCSAQSQTRVREDRVMPAEETPVAVVHVFDVQPAPNLGNGDLLIPAALSIEDTALILAELEGRIVNLPAREGSRVTKGEILAQLNDEAQRTQLRQAELEVSRLKVEAEQLQSLIKLNRSEFDRESLLARQGLVSKGEVERAQYKLEQSIQESEKIRLATESALARVEVVKLEMEKTTVRAPVAGVVTRRYIAAGTNVAKDDKLFEVAQLAKMELRFRVPQTYGNLLECGQVFGLAIDDQSAVIAKARIRRRDPIADAVSNTFGYVAEILGPASFIPGETVYVHLPRSGDSNIRFWLPVAAFPPGVDLKNGVSSTVFVIKGNKVSTRVVMVKEIEGDQVEIESGLVKDEMVVLTPPAGLKDGDRVSVGQP